MYVYMQVCTYVCMHVTLCICDANMRVGEVLRFNYTSHIYLHMSVKCWKSNAQRKRAAALHRPGKGKPEGLDPKPKTAPQPYLDKEKAGKAAYAAKQGK